MLDESACIRDRTLVKNFDPLLIILRHNVPPNSRLGLAVELPDAAS